MSAQNLEDSLQEEASTQVLYEQLQGEYNKLLKQYAAAENTIDELRTGATVNLYTEPIESRPNSRLSYEEARFPQNINFPRPLKASTSEFSTMNGTCSTITTGGRDESVKTPPHEQNNEQNLSLEARIQALKEDVGTVECILSERAVNNQETLNELLGICIQLYKEHGILTRELKLQSRNTMGLSGKSDGNNFSTKTELEKELYRIGLRIEEIQSDIMARLKTKRHTAVVKSAKPQSDAKPSLGSDLEGLVKEMKDLKDASIRSSEDVLNSSRMENTKSESVLPDRKYSEPRHDMMDSQYFSSSPVNMEYPPTNALSGSEQGSNNGGERAFNMTWPPSCNLADSDIGILRHSFSETTQDYYQNNSMSTQSGQSPQNAGTNRFSADNSKPSGKKQPREVKSNQRRSDLSSKGERRDPLNSANTREHSPYSDEEALHHRSEQDRSDPRSSGRDSSDHLNLGTTKERSPFSSQETVRYRSDCKSPDRERNGHLNSREHSPYSDQETLHQKEKREQLPKRTERILQEYESSQNKTPEHCLGSPDLRPRKFNSMSSLADSSRMSTPLFQPRGATRDPTHPTRGSTHAPRYKRRNPSDGFDSGFVGSEASRSSRLTTDHPDGHVQKLNISNQWDSSLHLDLVSEIDENGVSSSPEQISTTYEDGRQSPRKGAKSHQLSEDSKFINSSPSPLSSPESSPRTPAGYFGYRTSRTRLSSNGDSLPVHETGDPVMSSHVSEKASSERRRSGHSSSIDGTSKTRMDRRRISRYSGSRDVSPEVTADISSSGDRVRSRERTNEHNNERKLQALRNELDSLHDHVNKLQHPRVTMDMYDELRDHDEQLRRAHERRHERKFDALRQTIEQLKNDIKSRHHSQNRRKSDRDSEFCEDFRSELRKVTKRLDDLTTLRNTTGGLLESPTAHVSSSESPSTHVSPHDEDMARRFSNLVRKVDELRHRIENNSPRDNFDASRENSRHFCRLCNDVDVHHHGNQTINTADHQPRTSTPFVSDVHRPTGQLPTAKVDHRPYLSSTYPGAIPQQSPAVHHIHTYHRGPELKQEYETDSDDDNYVKRTPHRKRGVHRSRSRHDISYNDHLFLDEARKAAWDVQRLSKNILNTISLDLTSLRS